MRTTYLLSGVVLFLGICAAAAVIYAEDGDCSYGYECLIRNCQDRYVYSMGTGTYAGCSKSFWSSNCTGRCYTCTNSSVDKMCIKSTADKRCTENGVSFNCGLKTLYTCGGTWNNCTCDGDPETTGTTCNINRCSTG